jgi:CBS-domain-containing membrane protein
MKDMRWVDKKFKKNKLKYIFQCLIATVAILVILIFLDFLNEAAIIASLGASVFIIFTMPTSYSSEPRRLIGGYTVGLTTGIILYLISKIVQNMIGESQILLIIFGALAVGVAIFIMAITNTEHAPAAGISLGLMINQWDYITIIFIICAITFLCVIRKILKPLLMDLTSPTKFVIRK